MIDLLQDYDEYVIGYFESRDVILAPGGPTDTLRARLRPVMLDGRLVGYWRHTLTASSVEIETVDVPALTGRASGGDAGGGRPVRGVSRPARPVALSPRREPAARIAANPPAGGAPCRRIET